MKIRLSIVVSLIVFSVKVLSEIAPEPFGQVKKLPVPYPEHWVIAHDAAFFHMSAGKMVVLDAGADIQPQQFKGMFDTSLIGSFVQATSRPEMYVSETFYSRGSRGKRTDVVTIYDKMTLVPVGEIVLPGEKRASTMPERFSLQLVDNEKLLLVFNLTPATSVTVIDIVNRKVLNEVPIPGCSLIYPSGKRGFSSLCNNGSLYSVQLDKNGKAINKYRMNAFFDVDNAPLFEKPVYIDNVAYFPGFLGDVQPIDMSQSKPVLKKKWSLLAAGERKNGWRPGGWQLNAADTQGRMYILMNPKGKNGSHKDGGSEIWIYDVKHKKRIKKIVLKTWGVSIAVTGGKNPLIIITNAQMALDVYNQEGQYQRSMNFGQETPFVVYPSK